MSVVFSSLIVLRKSDTCLTAFTSPLSAAAVMSVPKVAMLGRTPRETMSSYTCELLTYAISVSAKGRPAQTHHRPT